MKQSLQNAISNLSKSFCKNIDWIFPRHCPICGQPDQQMIFDRVCTDCWNMLDRPLRTIFPKYPNCHIYSAAEYKTHLKRTLLMAKFKHDLQSTEILIRLVQRTFERIPFKIDVITSVPGEYFRSVWRGIDLPATLAKELSKKTGIACDFSLLKRVRHADRQTKQNRKSRLENMHGIFQADGSIQGKNILVVDDMITTGSTILSCYRAIRKKKPNRIVFLTAGKT